MNQNQNVSQRLDSTTVVLYCIAYNGEIKHRTPSPLIPIFNPDPDYKLLEYSHIVYHLENFGLQNLKGTDHFAGYLSPRFFIKTGFEPNQIQSALEASIQNNKKNVIIVNPWWRIDQTTINSFEQGQLNHNGLSTLLNIFLKDRNGHFLNATLSYSTKRNTTYSNFFIANYKFWYKWHQIVSQILSMANGSNREFGQLFYQRTDYVSPIRSRTGATTDGSILGIFFLERVVNMLCAEGSGDESDALDPFLFCKDPIIYVPRDLIDHVDSLRTDANYGEAHPELVRYELAGRQMRNLNGLYKLNQFGKFVDWMLRDDLWEIEAYKVERYTRAIKCLYQIGGYVQISHIWFINHTKGYFEQVVHCCIIEVVISLIRCSRSVEALALYHRCVSLFPSSDTLLLLKLHLFGISADIEAFISEVVTNLERILNSKELFEFVSDWLASNGRHSFLDIIKTEKHASINPLLVRSLAQF